jgi:hypothetical protein
MFDRLRATGPVALVPLAWSFVFAAHLGRVSMHALTVAHVLMAVLLALFAATSWNEMAEGALGVWRAVIAVGFVITVAGLVGLLVTPVVGPLLGVALIGWMLLPGVGLLLTARSDVKFPIAYGVAGVLSLVGTLSYLGALATPRVVFGFLGLALVGMGQTAGIVAAVVENE